MGKKEKIFFTGGASLCPLLLSTTGAPQPHTNKIFDLLRQYCNWSQFFHKKISTIMTFSKIISMLVVFTKTEA